MTKKITYVLTNSINEVAFMSPKIGINEKKRKNFNLLRSPILIREISINKAKIKWAGWMEAPIISNILIFEKGKIKAKKKYGKYVINGLLLTILVNLFINIK